MYFFSFLCEEPAYISPKFEAKRAFNVFTYPWTLLVVILTTTYSASLINQLNTPLSGDKLNSTEDILIYHPNRFRLNDEMWEEIRSEPVCTQFDDIAKVSNNQWERDGIRAKSNFKECFTLLSNVNPWCVGNDQIPKIAHPSSYQIALDVLNKYQVNGPKLKPHKMIDHCHRLHLSVSEALELFKKLDPTETPTKRLLLESAIERELTTCGKVAFSGKRSLLMKEMKYLQMHYKSKEFYAFTNEPLYSTFRGISFGRNLSS